MNYVSNCKLLNSQVFQLFLVPFETGTFERSFGGNEQAIKYAKTLHPIGRIGTPAEIASTVMYLCSEGAGFITGQSFIMDGGWSAGVVP
jgi:NAD(P)-dependent dehydrogenase (short-subunit alcohol dehydrogenase family)